MSTLAGVDKLDPKECLLAQNCRLDVTGDIQSAGAYTVQNTASYADSLGNTAIHSLFLNPSLGGIAGVGQDVFTGPTLGNMSAKLVGQNPNQQKMSFESAPGRIYFDVGSVGYWTDMNNLLLVDWAPPASAGGGTTGPTRVQTGSATGALGQPWVSPSGIASPSSYATVTLITEVSTSAQLLALNPGFALGTSAILGVTVNVDYNMGLDHGFQTAGFVNATLYVNGTPTGQTKNVNIHSGTGTVQFGNSSSLWGLSLTPAQINAANFGVQFTASAIATVLVNISLKNCRFTITQFASGTVAAPAGVGTLTGTYSWKVTFVAANGEESDGSSPTNTSTLSSQYGTLTAIPIGDARTTGRNIYRKGYAANTGLTLYYLVGSLQDNLSTTFLDNVTDIAALTEGVILAGDVPGDFPNTRLGNQQVRFPCYHYDRLFWINQTQPNQIIWSKPLDAFAYPVVNAFDVGDSKPISRIVSIFGELIIIKTDSIWRLTGTDESSFDLSQTPSSVGTDEPFTVEALPDKVIFANRYGLWGFNGYTSQPLTTKLDPWFKQLDLSGTVIGGYFPPPNILDPQIPTVFEGIGNSEKYYFAYADIFHTVNNMMLLFDVKHGNITSRIPSGFNQLSLTIDPVTGFVYRGDDVGFIHLYDDWTAADGNGLPVLFDFQHGYQDFQRGSNKALWALEFYLNTNGQSLTPTVYYDGGNSSEVLPAISTTGLQRVVRPVQSTASRKMQNFSWRLKGMLTNVNVSGLPQIKIVHVKALYDLRTGRARTGQT